MSSFRKPESDSQSETTSSSMSEQAGKISSVHSERTKIVGSTRPPEFSKLDTPEKREAFEKWSADFDRQYRRYHRPSLRFLNGMLRDEHQADEAWQNVATRWAGGGFKGYDRNLSFGNYLKTVLQNEVFAMWRKQKREVDRRQANESQHDYEDRLAEAASILFDRDLKDAILDNAFLNLKSEEREHFDILKSFRGRSLADRKTTHRDLAEKFSITEANARARVHRARKAYARQIVKEVAVEIQGEPTWERIQKVIDDLELTGNCQWAIADLKFAESLEAAMLASSKNKLAKKIFKGVKRLWDHTSAKRLAEKASVFLGDEVDAEQVAQMKRSTQTAFELLMVLAAFDFAMKESGGSAHQESVIKLLGEAELIPLCEQALAAGKEGVAYFLPDCSSS